MRNASNANKLLQKIKSEEDKQRILDYLLTQNVFMGENPESLTKILAKTKMRPQMNPSESHNHRDAPNPAPRSSNHYQESVQPQQHLPHDQAF
jgi:hypothetical protein